jgi:hypothetical protein
MRRGAWRRRRKRDTSSRETSRTMSPQREITAIVALTVLAIGGCLRPSTSARKSQKTALNIVDYRVKNVRDCPVHGATLQESLVEVSGGHASYDGAYYRARTELFPLAYTHMVVGDESHLGLVRYCPECRHAEAEWSRNFDPATEYQKLIDEAAQQDGKTESHVDTAIESQSEISNLQSP